MPQPIYMPPDPSGWGPALSGGIDKFTEAYLREKERKQQTNQMLLNMMMQYGGTLSSEQMGQIEKSMGYGPSLTERIGGMIPPYTITEKTPVIGPIMKLLGQVGQASPLERRRVFPEERGMEFHPSTYRSVLEYEPPKPKISPLRSLFEQVPGGYKIKGKEEREVETYGKKLGLETKAQKELTTFRTEEEIRGELLKIDKLTGKKRQVMLDDLRAQSEVSEELENKYFGSKLERMKQEATAKGDITTAQAIDQLQKEVPIKWEALKKEIELKGVEARKLRAVEQTVKLVEEQEKDRVARAKEKKADFNKTVAAINTAVAKLPGEEVTDEELEIIGRIAATYGFEIEKIPIKKTGIAGIDWMKADMWTYRLVDPETGMPPKIYEETGKQKGAERKDPFAQTGEQIQESTLPTYKYNPATGKLEKVK